VEPQVEVTDVGGVAIARLLGEHDLVSAPELKRTIYDLAARDVGVVVDVSETLFADVSVLRALADGDAALRERGRRLVVRLGTTCQVRRLFSFAPPDFLCVEDRTEAIAQAARNDRGDV
jgi:anti-anti-sigma regulatory factor